MDLSLSNRVALITGGSRGLGRAMAETFAQAGASVGVIARDTDVLAETLAALRTAGSPGAAHAAVSADVADAGELRRGYEEVVDACGPVDVLVNNAGTSHAKPFAEVTDDDWEGDLALKFLSAVRLCRWCLPHMREQRWGRIINTLNVAAKAPGARTCPTAVTRAAGMAMTKALASEVASDGVLVNCLNTGLLVSHQWETRWERQGGEGTFDEFTTKMGAQIPLGRMGDAQEFANLALFLASDAASYVTGAAINIDGGLSPVV